MACLFIWFARQGALRALAANAKLSAFESIREALKKPQPKRLRCKNTPVL